jgi:hypothetical protein
MQEPYVAVAETRTSRLYLERYQTGKISVGFDIRAHQLFSYAGTRALKDPRTHQAAASAAKNTITTRIVPCVIFIGDSNSGLQKNMFDRFFARGLKTTQMATNDGLVLHYRIKEGLQKWLRQHQRNRLLCHFNAGLHDIKMCF